MSGRAPEWAIRALIGSVVVASAVLLAWYAAGWV